MDMFQPNLTLSVEPDGEFTMHSVTIAPSSCYSAGPAVSGVPPNIRLKNDVFPVLLPIVVRGGFCMQVLTPLRHRLSNLKLGPIYGKTTLIAFATEGDHVLGSASILVGADSDPLPNKDPNLIDTCDWYAWINDAPPGPPTFHVTGVVHLPTAGYHAKLEPANPQGFNPKEFIVDLIVVPRPGFWPQQVTLVHVHCDRTQFNADYGGVLVRIPGGDVHFPVHRIRK